MRRSQLLAAVLAALAVQCGLAQTVCRSRDGGQLVHQSECAHKCCVQRADQGKVCGSADDCSNEDGDWLVMLMLAAAVAALLLFCCLLLLVCFDIPLPCCNQRVKSLLQRLANRAQLSSRTSPPPEPSPREPATPTEVKVDTAPTAGPAQTKGEYALL